MMWYRRLVGTSQRDVFIAEIVQDAWCKERTLELPQLSELRSNKQLPTLARFVFLCCLSIRSSYGPCCQVIECDP